MSMTIDPAAEKLAANLGEVVDHFFTTTFCLSGGPSAYADKPILGRLYDAARKLTDDKPLSFTAARALLQRVPMRGRVVFGTGFVIPPYLRLEGDGPIGTPFLARALALTREAHPIVVTEPANVPALEAVIRAAGLQVAPLEEALEVPHKAAVVPFPVADEVDSKAFAEDLLNRLKPDAIITIEKPARNRDGHYRNGMTIKVTDVVAKFDFMIEEARKRKILTVGFGDGGNEIGMGNILPTIEEYVPNGKLVGAVTQTDILVVASSAGWGAYGVEACIAALSGKPHALHDEEAERRVLDASVNAGIVDPLTGTAEGYLDGVPAPVIYAILRILRYLLDVRLHPWGVDLYRAWGARKEECEVLFARHAAQINEIRRS